MKSLGMFRSRQRSNIKAAPLTVLACETPDGMLVRFLQTWILVSITNFHQLYAPVMLEGAN
jgi:hypothetical protein